MGIIKGFLCSNCGFEKSYNLGVGFRGGRDKILYSCTDCNLLTASVLDNPKCNRCKCKRLEVVKDDYIKYTCPQCNCKSLQNHICGSWD